MYFFMNGDEEIQIKTVKGLGENNEQGRGGGRVKLQRRVSFSCFILSPIKLSYLSHQLEYVLYVRVCVCRFVLHPLS